MHLLDVRYAENGIVTPGIVQLPGDGAEIEEAVRSTGARLVVLDPIAAFLQADHSAYREQDVRAALGPLKTLAEQTGAAVVCIAHVNKSEGSDPLRRIANSGAFTQVARSVLVFGRDPEDPDGEQGSQRILTNAKMNAGADGNGLRLRIETTEVIGARGETIQTARLETIEKVRMTADVLLGSADDRGASGDAAVFLRELLADGPVAANAVKEAAEFDGHAWRTVKRAKQAAGAKSIKTGPDSGWVWMLKDRPPDGPLGTVGPLPTDTDLIAGPLEDMDGPIGSKKSKGAKGANGTEAYALADLCGSDSGVVDAIARAFDASEIGGAS